MRKIISIIVLCLTGVFLNMIIYRLFNMLGIPLYADTIATIAVTFTGGLLCGVLCGALTNIIAHSINFWSWAGYLFALCNIATAFITWMFCRFFPNQMNLTGKKAQTDTLSLPQQSNKLSGVMDRIVILSLLSFALCIAMSILGGFISTIIVTITPPLGDRSDLPGILSATMFTKQVPLILKEILSRIPINSIDRLISAFGGYGIALGIRALLIRIN